MRAPGHRFSQNFAHILSKQLNFFRNAWIEKKGGQVPPVSCVSGKVKAGRNKPVPCKTSTPEFQSKKTCEVDNLCFQE